MTLVCWKCGKLYSASSVHTTTCPSCSPKMVVTYTNNTKPYKEKRNKHEASDSLES